MTKSKKNNTYSYLLDSNVFIQAKNLHYGFDFCPAFWDWISLANGNGKVFSIEQVRDEILCGEDELTEWANTRGNRLFLSSTPESSEAHAKVIRWVLEKGYQRRHVDEFSMVADSHLIAHGIVNGHGIVTHEISSASRKKVKIPDVCVGLGIECLTPFEMLRRESARFVLGAPG